MTFPPPPHNEPLTMTCPRLRRREPLIVGLVMLLIWWICPRLEQQFRPLQFAGNYRTPYDRSEDYWRYRQFANRLAQDERILVLGDSVVWGEYVGADQTLSAELNQQLGQERFANGGINGLHPLAMHGLLRHYAKSWQAQPVLVHCNLLWLTSSDRDLSDDRNLSFNHPRLIPQLRRDLRSYQAPFATRLSVIVERNLEMRQWVRHLWIDYCGGQDLPHWTLEHPAEWPARRAIPALGQADSRQTTADWQERRIPEQDYPWISLAESQQWRGLQGLLLELKERSCPAFVLIGPFNSHLLSEPSRARWTDVRGDVQAWLDEQGIPYLAPAPLPSEMYADASHPLAEGYQQLSEQLSADARFREWLGEAR